MAGDFGRCGRCGSYVWLPHGCVEFECSIRASEAFWRTVWAHDAEQAAAKYAELYDCDGDYTILKEGDSGDTEVIVRTPESDDAPTLFRVWGETVAQYHAHKIKATAAST